MKLLECWKMPLIMLLFLLALGRMFANELDATDGDSKEESSHLVSLRQRRRDAYRFGSGHMCGGALITLNVVLTAAHCFLDQTKYDGSFLPMSDFIVVLGNEYRFKNSENTLIFGLRERLMQLNKLDLGSYQKDIAMLLLDGMVFHHNLNLMPIQLNNASLQPYTSCQLLGWSKTHIGYSSDMLLNLTVSLISAKDCESELNLSQHLMPGLMCARYFQETQSDPCTADSGGPLICQHQLAGIITWGINCQVAQLPSVYTDVFSHMQWIDDSLKEYASRANINSIAKVASVELGSKYNEISDAAKYDLKVIYIIGMFSLRYF